MSIIIHVSISTLQLIKGISDFAYPMTTSIFFKDERAVRFVRRRGRAR